MQLKSKRSFSNSNFVRLSGIILVLFLAFSPHVNASNNEKPQPDIEKLMEDFLSDNYGVAFRVQDDVIQLGETIIPALRYVLEKDANIWNKVKVINVLDKIGGSNAMQMLVKCLEAEDELIRNTAFETISKLDGESKLIAVGYLIPYIVHEKVWIRDNAIALLFILGEEKRDIATELMDIFDTGDNTQREIALKELAKLGSAASNTVNKLLTCVELNNPEKFDDSVVILRTITQIGDTPDQKVRSLLFELLLSSDFDLRQEAIWGMRWLGFSGEEMLVPLEPLLNSDSAPELKLAVEILGHLGITQPSAVQKLMELIKTGKFSVEITSDAIHELENLVPQLEYDLGRGLVAIATDEGVFLSWRLLGTEAFNTGFNVYRNGQKVNLDPIVKSTNYLDPNGHLESSYFVKAVVADQELAASETVMVLENNYLSIPINKPEGGASPTGERYAYHANECSVGDLTGSNTYDIILKWDPSNYQDNSRSGYTGNVFIDAYTLDGEQLWRIDLGRNIRAGAHYTQMMVYDLDGDGKAEVVLKTADGTVDGLGNVIGDPNVDYRNSSGRVLSGPEYLTVFDGETGRELHTIEYKPSRGKVSDWGDDYGNRVDRFLAAIAYLDGNNSNPSVIMCRGYYSRTVLVAYDLVDGKLRERWTFDTDSDPELKSWAGQGNHQLSVADVDGDGKDEIIYGAMTVDHDGTGLYNLGLRHGDALHVGVFEPNKPGLQVFGVHEIVPNDAGINFRDARTGAIFWSYPTDYDVGRGVAAHIDPRYASAQTWASRTGLMDIEGNEVSRTAPPMAFVTWWDGDLQREVMENTTISKWDWENEKEVTLISPQGLGTSTNKPPLQADLFGDWREEVIWRTADSSELRIYTTTDVTDYRIYTLMHDRMYRLAIAWQNVAYNQPPHPSFYIGEGMQLPDYNPGLIISFLEQLDTK